MSNSLKFTPEGGQVQVRIKCLGEGPPSDGGSRNSMGSKQSSQRASQRTSRNRHRNDAGANGSPMSRKPSNSGSNPLGTALLINPMDPTATPRVIGERAPTPPPPGARVYTFQFEVEDTGPGIPESQRRTVFEPFMQGDLGLSKKYGGTGLGLSICSQLATTMGGSIALDSTEGVGSIFTVLIPLKHTKSRGMLINILTVRKMFRDLYILCLLRCMILIDDQHRPQAAPRCIASATAPKLIAFQPQRLLGLPTQKVISKRILNHA